MGRFVVGAIVGAVGVVAAAVVGAWVLVSIELEDDAEFDCWGSE